MLGDHGGDVAAVVLYAANLSGVVLTGMWMAADARRAGLTSIDAAAHHEQRYRSLYIAAVFLASIPVAVVAPAIAPSCGWRSSSTPLPAMPPPAGAPSQA